MKQEIKDFFKYNRGWLILDTLLVMFAFFLGSVFYIAVMILLTYGVTLFLWFVGDFSGRNRLKWQREFYKDERKHL